MSSINFNSNRPEPLKSISDESSLNYEERRVLDLSLQVLNGRLNFYQDDKNVTELMRVYQTILQSKTNNDYQFSMSSSRECYSSPAKIYTSIDNLKTNNSSSFIVMPIKAQGHMFAGVIRKIGNDYSFMVVNKGARTNHKPYEEYILSRDNLHTAVSIIQEKPLPIGDVYNVLKETSKGQYIINVSAKNQKIGNCFIKEPENAIKYATATAAISTNELISLRDANQTIKIKWPLPTGEMHNRFVNRLMIENPSISGVLRKEWEKYGRNKMFRNYINSGLDPKQALFKAFDPSSKTASMPESERIENLLKQINFDTIYQNGKNVKELANQTNNPNIAKLTGDLSYYMIIGNLFMSNLSLYESMVELTKWFGRKDSFYERLQSNFKLGDEFLPNATEQLKYDYHTAYMMSGLMNGFYGQNKVALEKLGASEYMYPYDAQVTMFKGFAHLGEGNIQAGKQCLQETLRLKPDLKEAREFLDEINSMSKDELADIKKTNYFIKYLQKLGFVEKQIEKEVSSKNIDRKVEAKAVLGKMLSKKSVPKLEPQM